MEPSRRDEIPIEPLALALQINNYEHLSKDVMLTHYNEQERKQRTLEETFKEIESSIHEIRQTITDKKKADANEKRIIEKMKERLAQLISQNKQTEKTLRDNDRTHTELMGKYKECRKSIEVSRNIVSGLKMDMDARAHAEKEEKTIQYIRMCMDFLVNRKIPIPFNASMESIVFNTHQIYNRELVKKFYPTIDVMKGWNATKKELFLNFNLGSQFPVGSLVM